MSPPSGTLPYETSSSCAVKSNKITVVPEASAICIDSPSALNLSSICGKPSASPVNHKTRNSPEPIVVPAVATVATSPSVSLNPHPEISTASSP